MPRAFPLAMSRTPSSLMGVVFLTLQNSLLDFFPGIPIGAVPQTRFTGVGCAHQRWGKKDLASSLLGIGHAIFGEEGYERGNGQCHEAKYNDHSHVYCCSPCV